MPKIERIDIITILNTFNRGETILYFDESSFSVFTIKSIGIDLTKQYGCPNKKNYFFLDETKKTSYKVKLLNDLLIYYVFKKMILFGYTHV